MAESAARSGLSRGVDPLRVKIRDKGLVKNKTSGTTSARCTGPLGVDVERPRRAFHDLPGDHHFLELPRDSAGRTWCRAGCLP